MIRNGLIVEEKEIDFETWTGIFYFFNKKFAGGIENPSNPLNHIYRNMDFDINKIYLTGKLNKKIDLKSPQIFSETMENILKENNIKINK